MESYIFMLAVLLAVVAIILIATFTKFKLDNEQYDRLKWVVMKWDYIVIFVALVVKLFDMPYGIETVSLVAGIGAMLGGLLDVSSKSYKKDGLTQMFNEDLLKDIVGYKQLNLDREEEAEDGREEGE